MAFGLSQLRNMRMGLYPEFSPVYVEVQTEALGLSAEEVEQLLTVALEQDLLNGIAYLDEIWSESLPSLSRVVCVFEPGTDPMIARQVVAERLTQAHALPHVSKPPIMLQPYSSTSRIMQVGITPSTPELSLIDLSVLARWTIQPYLMGIEGVANVSIWGQRKRQLQVQVDPAVLSKNGVVLQDIIKTTGEALWVSPLSYLNSSTPGTGGFFDTPNQRLGIRHLLPISTPEELAQIPVDGHDIALGDITKVVKNHQPLIGDAIVNGSQGLMLVIEKFPWAGTIEVTERVEEALDALAPGLTGVAFDSDIYAPANFVETSFVNISTATGIGLGLVVLMLLLFFYEWRSVVVSATAILISLTAGAYVLHLRGVIFDMMAIAGFIAALGVIIDDAITTVDHIRRNLQKYGQNGSEESATNIILKSVLEIRRPVFFATFIVLLAVVPLFFLLGVAGIFISSIAASYVLALVASALTAMIVTPALSMTLLSRAENVYRESPLFAPLIQATGSLVKRFVQRPLLGYVTLGMAALVGFLSIPMINFDPQIPIPKERDLVVQWNGEYGASHTAMAGITIEAIGKLRSIPGVVNAAAHLGRAVLSDKSSNVHAGEIWISLDEEADYDKTLASVQKVLNDYPQMDSKVQTYQQQCLNRTMKGINHMHAVRVYGENQEILTKKTEEIQNAISGIKGISKAKVEYPPTEPTIEIEVDLEKARQYDIKPGDVRRTATTLIAGIEAGSLFEGQKVFEVVVWGVPEVRNSIESVRNLLIDTPDGGQVRIGDVAEVRETETVAVIKREKVSRYMDISFDYAGRNIDVLQADIDRSLAQVTFPLEYHAELVGAFAERAQDRRELLGVAIAALIGILLLLQAAFWGWRLAMVVLPALLLSASGGLLAILLTGGHLSLGAIAGLAAVLGISAYNGVLLIRRFINLEITEEKDFGPDLIQQGVRDRVGPILTTHLTMMVGLLPFIIFGNAPGLEVTHPMALVAFGGLITSAAVTLFVLPALYLGFGKVSNEVRQEERAMLELESLPSVVSS
jgi:Cu/Ag efflux pump CusA